MASLTREKNNKRTVSHYHTSDTKSTVPKRLTPKLNTFGHNSEASTFFPQIKNGVKSGFQSGRSVNNQAWVVKKAWSVEEWGRSSRLQFVVPATWHPLTNPAGLSLFFYSPEPTENMILWQTGALHHPLFTQPSAHTPSLWKHSFLFYFSFWTNKSTKNSVSIEIPRNKNIVTLMKK